MPVRDQDELKQQAAWRAVEYVQSGMVIGLGTGSTAAYAVDRIGQLLKEDALRDIVAVPTSVRTYEQAKGASLRAASTCCRQRYVLVQSQAGAVQLYPVYALLTLEWSTCPVCLVLMYCTGPGPIPCPPHFAVKYPNIPKNTQKCFLPC